MKRLAILTSVAGVLAALAIGTPAAQASTTSGSGNGNKTYTCSNQGGGPNHKVVCNGTASNGSLVNVTVSDVNVLNGTQLTVLQDSLNNATVLAGDVSPTILITDLDAAVVSTYLTSFDIVLATTQVCTCSAGLCG